MLPLGAIETVTQNISYEAMIKQVNRDVTDPRGNNIKLSFKMGGVVVNKRAHDYFNEKDSLKEMGNEMISDADLGKYEKILETKPEGVDPKEYIVVYMLYLGSQNSLNQLSLRGPDYLLKFGTSPEDTDCLVDFDKACVGLAQTCRSIFHNTKLRPVHIVVKMAYNCQENIKAAQTSFLAYDTGRLKPDEIQKAFSLSD